MDYDLSAPFLSRFFQRTTAGIKPGLQVIEALLARLENPENKFIVLHVAGTNGKGSVCAMLERILREAGFRTGLYTSPHLVRFHERIRVNGEEITDAEAAALAKETESADRAMCAETGLRPATFFELGTAMGFLHFARKGVQVAVIEVGLGGRWDATNVVHPLVSVITPVGMDHMEFLGDTLAKIAAEKAGIIKPIRPVVVAAQEPEAMKVIAAEARRQNAPLVLAEDDAQLTRGGRRKAKIEARVSELAVRDRASTLDPGPQTQDPPSLTPDTRHPAPLSSVQRISLQTPASDYGTLELSLLGPHQATNAAVAVLAAERAFQEMGLPLDPDVVKAALRDVRWPARFQMLENQPPVILDGAHNPAAAAVLAAALKSIYPKKKGAFVLGFSRDKDALGVLRELAPRMACAWTVAYAGERALPADRAAELCASLKIPAEPSTLTSAIEAARAWAKENDGFVCICGSLYLAGEVLASKGTG